MDEDEATAEAVRRMSLDRLTFEAIRDDLLKKRADIDALIAALNVVLADDLLMSPRIVVALETAPEVLATPSTRQITPPRPKPSPDEWADRRARAQIMYMQGTGPQEISDTLHVSIRRVDKWVQRGKWREQRVAILRERSGEENAPEAPPPTLDTAVAPTIVPSRPGDKARAKDLFMSGKFLNEIAEELSLPPGRIYYWSCQGKWRQERDAKAKHVATEPDETVERFRAQRRAADDQVIQEVKRQVDARDWSGLGGGGAFRQNGAFE